MPKRVECGDVVLQNGSGTATAFRSKHVKVILSAICLAIFLMETYPEEDQGSKFVQGIIIIGQGSFRGNIQTDRMLLTEAFIFLSN